MIATHAERDGDEYVINGHKWFASNASMADFILMMAVTNPDNPPHKAASFFIIPKGTPGLDIARDVFNMGHPYPGHFRSGGHAEIFLRDCRVPVANRVGAEGDGFVLAQKRLNGGRIHHAMRWVGQCEARVRHDVRARRQPWHQGRAAHREADDPGDDRRVVGRHPRRCGCMALHSAWLWDNLGASKARVEIAELKFWGARVLHDVIDRAIQVHGALGWSMDLPLASMYVMARQFRIADGADEVHKSFVANKRAKAYKPVEQGWPSAHVPTRKAELRERFAEFLDHEAANF